MAFPALCLLQNAKLSLQTQRGYASKLCFDFTGGICDKYLDQEVYGGWISAQNERVPEVYSSSGSRDGAGGVCGGLIVSTRQTTEAVYRGFGRWLDVMESKYP